MFIFTCPGRAFDWKKHVNKHIIMRENWFLSKIKYTLQSFGVEKKNCMKKVTFNIPHMHYLKLQYKKLTHLTQISELSQFPPEAPFILYWYAICTFRTTHKYRVKIFFTTFRRKNNYLMHGISVKNINYHNIIECI